MRIKGSCEIDECLSYIAPASGSSKRLQGSQTNFLVFQYTEYEEWYFVWALPLFQQNCSRYKQGIKKYKITTLLLFDIIRLLNRLVMALHNFLSFVGFKIFVSLLSFSFLVSLSSYTSLLGRISRYISWYLLV